MVESKREAGALGGGAMASATRRSLVAAAFGALFLTVCNNQPLFAVYLANHLGMSSSFLGALFGFMLATGALQLVSVFIYRSLPSRKAYWIVAHLVHRCLGFAIAASALIFSAGAQGLDAARIAALALGLSWVFMNASSSGWLAWMADLVPEEVRGSFFLRRSAIFQSATVLWFFAASVLLDLVPMGARSLAYALIFGIGAAGGVVDILLHLRIPEPPYQREAGRLSAEEFLSPLRDRNFLRYSLGIGMAVFAIFVASPFQAPRVTSPAGIGAPNVWLGIMTVITILAWVAMAPLWGFVMDRYGRKPAVVMGTLLVSGWIAYPFVNHDNYAYILPLIAALAGFFGPAFWEGAGQLMLTLAPVPRRVVYIAWYNTLVGLVSALGPVAGGLIEERVGAAGGLSISPGWPPLSGFAASQFAALLAMAAAILVLRGVREGKERPVVGLVSQMASAGLFRTYASLLDLRRRSGDPRVARALRRIDGDEGEMVLREVVQRLDDPAPEVREEAVRALARVPSPESAKALARLLGDRESDLRIEAARALGRLGDSSAVPALESALREEDPLLRAASAGALAGIAGRSPGTRLATHLESECDDRVLGAAALGAASGPSGEAGDELVEATLELASRLAATGNRALRLQYAIGIANLIGHGSDFARYATGEEAAREARVRELLEALARRVSPLLGAGKEDGRDSLSRLEAALGTKEGARALEATVELHELLMKRLFGCFGEGGEFADLVARIDVRLGAWQTIVSSWRSGRLAFGDDETALLVALVGVWYLSSE